MRAIIAALFCLCACQTAAGQAIPLRYGQAYSALRSIFALPLFVAEREGYFVREVWISAWCRFPAVGSG